MPPKAQKIFLTAEAFWDASNALADAHHKTGKSIYLIPIWVNQALALEIYFKCLWGLASVKIKWTHDLLKLFNGLPPDFQNAILVSYDEVAKKDARHQQFEKDNPQCNNDLVSFLTDSAKLFEKLRYAYRRTWKPHTPRWTACANSGRQECDIGASS